MDEKLLVSLIEAINQNTQVIENFSNKFTELTHLQDRLITVLNSNSYMMNTLTEEVRSLSNRLLMR